MKAPRETDLVRQVLDWLALRRWFAFRVNNTGIYDPARRRFRSFQGMKGVADVYALRDGVTYWIECKGERGTLSPEQELFRDNVRRNGGCYLCVRSLEELLAGLEELGA